MTCLLPLGGEAAKSWPASDIFGDAHHLEVFEIDSSTGFMAPSPPPARLPADWEVWEAALDDAMESRVQLGNKIGLTKEEMTRSETWRANVRALPVVSVSNHLRCSMSLLRRAHVVLTFIQHFYLHSLPPMDARIIPRPIALPLLFVSAILKVPPLLTYADVVLYNWRIESETPGRSSFSVPAPIPVTASPTDPPHLNHIRSQKTFTRAPDEEEFYLCSARIELRGAQALSLMRAILDEIFVGDDIAARRTTKYLSALARVIHDMKALLEGLKTRCDPDMYYNDVRPWLCGQDADARGRKWVFEGLSEDGRVSPTETADAGAVRDVAVAIAEPAELSGPSAGQSSVIHVLDVFLGVDHELSDGKPSFMTRMKAYMPYQHRLFIDHLASYPRSLRAFVVARQGVREGELKKAYNEAVNALKVFRDAHMIMAALYILGPARRARDRAAELEDLKVKQVPERKPHIGTGGTELVSFLKDTRTRTMRTVIPESECDQ